MRGRRERRESTRAMRSYASALREVADEMRSNAEGLDHLAGLLDEMAPRGATTMSAEKPMAGMLGAIIGQQIAIAQILRETGIAFFEPAAIIYAEQKLSGVWRDG